jgi:hypothetical protein
MTRDLVHIQRTSGVTPKREMTYCFLLSYARHQRRDRTN